MKKIKIGSILLIACLFFSLTIKVVNAATIKCPSCGADAGALKYLDGTAATCTKGGTTHYYCMYCGTDFTLNTSKALGHKWTIDSQKEPTCTEDGYKEMTCSRCHEHKTKTIEALGHKLKITTIEPTCDTEGHLHEECTRCLEVVTDEPIPALGHEVSFIITKEATCIEEGTKEGTCNRCNETIKETIPALGHKYGEWVVEKEPTSLAKGLQVKTCEVCGERLEEAIPKKDMPMAVPIVGGTIVIGGVILAIIKKKAASKVVKDVAKKVSEEIVKEAIEPSIEEKTMVTCLDTTSKLYTLIKANKYISVVESEYDELFDTIDENEPASSIIDLSDKKLPSFIKKLEDEKEIVILLTDKQIEKNKGNLDKLIEEKKISAYCSNKTNPYIFMAKYILKAMKPTLNSDETLENVGMIADILGIPFVSTVTNAYVCGREVKETFQESEELGVVDCSTIISDIASILGFDKVSSVAGLVGDIDDIKTSFENKIGGNEVMTNSDAVNDIIDVVSEIIDK